MITAPSDAIGLTEGLVCEVKMRTRTFWLYIVALMVTAVAETNSFGTGYTRTKVDPPPSLTCPFQQAHLLSVQPLSRGDPL